jgi:Helitron helicase-like domain at N-terminus
MYHHFGCPSIFLTITPDDDSSFTIQTMPQQIIDDKQHVHQINGDEFIARAKLRTKLHLQYPGICALYFQLSLQTIISEVFGWDLQLHRQIKPSLFGTIEAFTCSIEEQGRGTLHVHCIIWVPLLKDAIDNLHNRVTFEHGEKVIVSVMDEAASNRCFFQKDALLDGRRNKRKRFVHSCQNINYCLPKFPYAKRLRLRQSDHIENNKVISCKHCDCKWSFCDSYLKHYICLPGYTTINKERHKKQ